MKKKKQTKKKETIKHKETKPIFVQGLGNSEVTSRPE